MNKKYQIKTIPLAHIVADMDINPRDEIDNWTVERYAGIIETMPDMEVFDVAGVGYLLAAGFHRYEAHKLTGTEKVRVKIYVGTREEAQAWADRSNAKNPLQLKPEELLKLGERALLRDPGASDDAIMREYGVPKAMLRDIRKRLDWETGSFPQIREMEESDIPTVDPRLKERPWWELHFLEQRRRTTLPERLLPCEVCGWPISQRAHLLDVATWGENPHVMCMCVRCHELFDLILAVIEKRGKRARPLITKVKDELGDNAVLDRLTQEAETMAQVRGALLERRNRRLEHLEQNWTEAQAYAKEHSNGK